MRQCLTGSHPVDGVAVLVAALIETLHHFVFGNKGFDDAQPAQRLFQLRHGVTPLCLRIQRLPFQFLAHRPHYPAHARKHQQCEQCQLPTDGYQRSKISYNQYRVLYQHVQRTGYGRFHLGHITAHAGNDVALPLFGEETQRKMQHLVIYLRADITNHPRTEGNHHRRRSKIGKGFQQSHHRQKDTQNQQRQRTALRGYQLGDVVVEVIDRYIFQVNAYRIPRNELVGLGIHLEKYLENRNNQRKRKYIQNCR